MQTPFMVWASLMAFYIASTFLSSQTFEKNHDSDSLTRSVNAKAYPCLNIKCVELA